MKKLIRKLLYPFSYTCSQAGQDIWVSAEVFDETKSGFFLDIGAHDGVEISNTYILERRYGWNGICIEANPDTFIELENNRRAKCVQACVDSSEEELVFRKRGMSGGIVGDDMDNKLDDPDEGSIRVKGIPLSKLLEENHAPKTIEYLSIDVEGAEDRVLLDFDFSKYTFLAITIERPSVKLRAKLNENGYVLIKDIPNLDCFYIHESIVPEYRNRMVAFYCKKFLRFRWR